MPKKSILFIINPISGRRRLNNIADIIQKEVDAEKYTVNINFTESAGHASVLSKEAVENKTDFIVAVGGDGTINEVASQMIGTESVLGIIPGGSGNGLARHLGIPLVPEKAVQLVFNGKISKIDTGTVNEKNFISIAGIGFDALVAKLFSENKKRGFLTYLSLIAQQFSRYREKKYTLEFENGETLITKALFISFANSNQFGYNTTISPNAQLNDGLLDVCIVKKPKFIDLPGIINLLLLKKIDQSPFVKIRPAKKIIIKRSKNRFVNIDGEAIKLKKNLIVEINPLSLNVIIPK
ncbi:MAG TPA: diacylglycerol kinase family protein [Bacteroidales bacterium]